MVDQGLVVALLGNGDISQELGKKSGETDLALFHFREGGRPVSTLAPIRFPEKVQPLAHAVLVADAALLAVGGRWTGPSGRPSSPPMRPDWRLASSSCRTTWRRSRFGPS